MYTEMGERMRREEEREKRTRGVRGVTERRVEGGVKRGAGPFPICGCILNHSLDSSSLSLLNPSHSPLALPIK